jgi:hypothetical protein
MGRSLGSSVKFPFFFFPKKKKKKKPLENILAGFAVVLSAVAKPNPHM